MSPCLAKGYERGKGKEQGLVKEILEGLQGGRRDLNSNHMVTLCLVSGTCFLFPVLFSSTLVFGCHVVLSMSKFLPPTVIRLLSTT